MDEQLTIKEVLASKFEVKLPPNYVFVLYKGVVASVTKDMLATIDKTFQLAGFNAFYRLPMVENV